MSLPSKPVTPLILFLHSRAFPGICAGLLFSHLAKWQTSVLGHHPFTPLTQGVVAISKVVGLKERPQWLHWLSAVWPHSGWETMGWDGGCGVGDTYWQRPAMFSEAQSSGSITQCDEEKRPAANESQQCLSHRRTT